MLKIFFIFVINIGLSFSKENFKVMTFNTMCDFCTGSDFFSYSKRIKKISGLIKKHDPDLISLQEVRTKDQIELILKGLKGYSYATFENKYISYADTAILYKNYKYKILNSRIIWLGPKQGSISFGWKFSLPRMLQLVEFKSRKNIFTFANSHFDNRIENLEKSSAMANKYFKKIKNPLIFAADTNTTTDMIEYQDLLGNELINTFDYKKKFLIYGDNKESLCYLRKGKDFPKCRVDHILVSKKHKWNVLSFRIDTSETRKVPMISDHRPIIVELELLD